MQSQHQSNDLSFQQKWPAESVQQYRIDIAGLLGPGAPMQQSLFTQLNSLVVLTRLSLMPQYSTIATSNVASNITRSAVQRFVRGSQQLIGH